MSEAHKKYWFAAKKWGWGWALPSAWQGWAVLAAFLALVAVALTALGMRRIGLLSFLLFVIGLSILFLVVCWLKGEEPRWRP